MDNLQIILLLAYSLGLAGSILLFFFGLPRLDINPDGSESLDISLGPDKEAKNRQRWLKYDRLSHLGITMIAISFLVQIISLWISK